MESLRSDDGKEQLYMTYHQTIMEHEEMALQQGIEKGMRQGIEKGMKQGIKQGMQQGIKQGIEKGRFNTLVELVQDGMIDIQKAAQKSGMPLEAFRKLFTPAD